MYFTVSHPRAKLAFTSQPAGATGGVAFTGSPAGVALACTTNPVSPISRLATFSGCRIDKIGTYALTATAPAATGATTGSATARVKRGCEWPVVEPVETPELPSVARSSVDTLRAEQRNLSARELCKTKKGFKVRALIRSLRKGRRVELRDYIRILRKSWVLIVLLTLVAVGAASTYSILQTPEFSATSKVFVSTQASGTTSDLAQGSSFTVQRVKTYSDLVATPIVLLPVIATLDLGITADQLAKEITASAPLDTSIIEITVTDTDPVRAADIANAASQSLTAVVQDIETPEAADAVSPVKLTRAQEATVPSIPVSPNVPLNIALGALAGLALGVGLAVLRETLDTRIRTERDVESVTDVAILGGIVFDPKAQERPLIVHVDPRSPRAESFRTLRTNLQFLDVGRTDRSFVITSSIESEGKSTTGANLAIALADSGARVLLIDADLRRPKIHDYMGIDGTVGLTDLLVGRAELKDIIQPWGKGKLFVLPAGHVPPNPSELLGSARMSHFIGEFNKTFDVVIFDAPPLLPVTDAAILAKNVGGAIIVVAAGRTHKNQLKGAIAALDNVGAPISGLVLTMLPTKGPDSYGYGRYGYGYGYGAEETPEPKTRKARALAKAGR